MNLYVNNETAPLEAVVLGIGTDRGTPRAINPTIRQHLQNNTYPTTKEICREIKDFEMALRVNGVEVYRPENLDGVEQIFTRDIGFVIEDKFMVSKMKHKERKEEFAGLHKILEQVNKDNIIRFPDDVLVEGGDVIVWNDYIFIGITARTNKEGVAFLQEQFPNKKVIGFPLTVDQDNAAKHILHLDCAFQPIGTDEAIIYLDGFKNSPTELLELFPEKKRIHVNMEQKIKMFPNVFSISPSKIVIEKGFVELRDELLKRNFEVYEVNYKETSKLGGLLRCSTLPLRRRK